MTASGAGTAAVPLEVRLHLGRAAVQTVADDHRIDLLHIKGDAVDRAVRPFASAGSDIDVLVRPSQVEPMDRALRAHGWKLYSTFENGSPFGHAQTYLHEVWGYVDLHRRFPGIRIDPAEAFDRFWNRRGSIEFAGVDCPVPDIAAQSAILILNAARDPAAGSPDVRHLWTDATDEARTVIRSEIDALHARLAMDAALGDIRRHRGDREFRLWLAVSQGGTRAEEWWGRVVAEPTWPARIRMIGHLLQVNREHLAHQLGHVPSRGDVTAEALARPLRGIRESLVRAFGRGGSRRAR